MTDRTEKEKESDLGQITPSSLRSKTWERFIRGPDPQLLEKLYVPALSESIRYDRCCAYFSSSVLAAAARGFGKLIERLIAMGDDAVLVAKVWCVTTMRRMPRLGRGRVDPGARRIPRLVRAAETGTFVRRLPSPVLLGSRSPLKKLGKTVNSATSMQ